MTARIAVHFVWLSCGLVPSPLCWLALLLYWWWLSLSQILVVVAAAVVVPVEWIWLDTCHCRVGLVEARSWIVSVEHHCCCCCCVHQWGYRNRRRRLLWVVPGDPYRVPPHSDNHPGRAVMFQVNAWSTKQWVTTHTHTLQGLSHFTIQDSCHEQL